MRKVKRQLDSKGCKMAKEALIKEAEKLLNSE